VYVRAKDVVFIHNDGIIQLTFKQIAIPMEL
jgi:hypothetical protein